MTPEFPTDPRQALEVSLTAWLLGELPPDQAEFLQKAIAQDPELARQHERLKQTIGLVRQVTVAPAGQSPAKQAEQASAAASAQPATPAPALKLSDERREELLARFKMVRPKEFARKPERRMHWLVPVAAAVVLMAMLSAMLLPALSRAKSKSMAQRPGEPAAEGVWYAKSPQRRLSFGVQSSATRPSDSEELFAKAEKRGAPATPAPAPPVKMQIELPKLAQAGSVNVNGISKGLSSEQAGKQDLFYGGGYGGFRAGKTVNGPQGVGGVPLTQSASESARGVKDYFAAGDYALASPAAGAARTRSGSVSKGIPFSPDGRVVKGDELRVPASTAPTVGGGMLGGMIGGAGGGLPADQVARLRQHYARESQVVAGTTVASVDDTHSKQSDLGLTDGSTEVAGGAIRERVAGVAPSRPVDESKTRGLARSNTLAWGYGNRKEGDFDSTIAAGRLNVATATPPLPVLGDLPIAGQSFRGRATTSAGEEVAKKPEAAPAEQKPTGGPNVHDLNVVGYVNVPTTNGYTLFAQSSPKPNMSEFYDYSGNFGKSPQNEKGQVSKGVSSIVLPSEPNLESAARSQAGAFVQDGRVLTELGNLEQAKEKLEQAVKLAPQNQSGRESLNTLAEAETKYGMKGGATEGREHVVDVERAWAKPVASRTPAREIASPAAAAAPGGGERPLNFGGKDRRVPSITLEGLTTTLRPQGFVPVDPNTGLPMPTAPPPEKVAPLERAQEQEKKGLMEVQRENAAQIGTPVQEVARARLQEALRNGGDAVVADGEQTRAKSEGGGKSRAIAEARREVEELSRLRQQLELKAASEGKDLKLAKTKVVAIVDRAEANADQAPTLGERFQKAFTGDVERKARIKIERDRTDIAGLQGPNLATSYDPYFIQTEPEVIQSEAVLGQVVDKLNLEQAWGEKYGRGEKLSKPEAVRKLREMMDVKAVPNTSQVDIGVKSPNAEEAAKIANTVAESYRDHRVEQRERLTSGGIEALTKRNAEVEQKLALARKKLHELEQRPVAKQPDVAAPKPAVPPPTPQPEVQTAENAFSTFSLNVSDVSFKLAGASLEKGAMPAPASIRSEEFINAFDYRDPEPAGGMPVAFAWDRAAYPFAQNRDLLRFSIKTAALGRQAGRPMNLVLLLDNSGSMERADRVRIIHEALRVLATQLHAQDKLTVITFARTARLWVNGVPGTQAGKVAEEVSGLTPQGGTNLEEAMKLGYEAALRHYMAGGINRVVLLTDGAANLGDVDPEALKKSVEAHRQQGIALDCFGIGWEGYNDDLLEVLSRNGDGRYGFINTPEEAVREFAGQLAGALHVAASDVKVQVEFNPNRVTAYRQIGYAKHQLTKEQFRDNTVDAAEIGATESGNALYVVETNPQGEGPLAIVRVRYKIPGTTEYHEHEWAVPYTGNAGSLAQASPAMRLAATASAFSEWLASSPYAAEVTPDALLSYLGGVPETYGADARPKKLEWMIRQAKSLAAQ